MLPMIIILLSFIAVLSSTSSSSPQKIYLTKQNYEPTTFNKTVFIKWAAPWCSHSQELAPHWDQLLESFDSINTTATGEEGGQEELQSTMSSQLLIGEVDCSKESDWCVEMGYTAYPTLSYGDPSMDGLFLQTYQSTKKEYVDLLDFVQTQLVSNRTTTTSTTTFCTPGNYKYSQHCDDQQRTKIQLYYDISMEKLNRSSQRKKRRYLQQTKNLIVLPDPSKTSMIISPKTTNQTKPQRNVTLEVYKKHYRGRNASK
jgi:thiol-disulfide isomerase/thioredoxin